MIKENYEFKFCFMCMLLENEMKKNPDLFKNCSEGMKSLFKDLMDDYYNKKLDILDKSKNKPLEEQMAEVLGIGRG